MELQPISVNEGRELLYHVADQCGPDQVAELMIDYLRAVVGEAQLTEFQADMLATLDALTTRHLGPRL